MDVSEMMVRKQVYLSRRQNQMIKRLARQRKVSESEVIRQAIDQAAESGAPVRRDTKKVFNEMASFARSLREQPELMKGKAIQWDRQELYEEREKRLLKKGKRD